MSTCDNAVVRLIVSLSGENSDFACEREEEEEP
jgi:hypothetical protein